MKHGNSVCFVRAVWCVSNLWWPFWWQRLSQVACELPSEAHPEHRYTWPLLAAPAGFAHNPSPWKLQSFSKSWNLAILLGRQEFTGADAVVSEGNCGLSLYQVMMGQWLREDTPLEIVLKHNDGKKLSGKAKRIMISSIEPLPLAPCQMRCTTLWRASGLCKNLEQSILPLMVNSCLEDINQGEDYGLELSGFLPGMHMLFSGLNSY